MPFLMSKRSTRVLRVLALGFLGQAFTAISCAANATTLEEIVITATRRPEPALRSAASIARLTSQAIVTVGATHHSEILNRVPGTLIQRGSGQESLTAVRSPVLTGPGSCGAFLMLENGVPIRPVGFCNVNEMFELNTEQAEAIEVLRGPSNSLYGSNAVHGTINVLQPSPADRPALSAGVDVGPDDYGRLKLAGRAIGTRSSLGLAGLYAHDGGWRASSGFDEGKLNATLATAVGAAPLRVDFAGTILDQQTAGFIAGEDAYRDEELSRSNPNPDAYRKAHALRLTGLIAAPPEGRAQLELRPYLRSSRMEFLQHFLLGKPVERNGQESAGLMSSLRWDRGDAGPIIAGLDLELAHSFLLETQDGPTTDGPPDANAIRPAGRHYDYTVDSAVVGAYVQGEQRLSRRWSLSVGLRAEYVHYDYDNRMLAGNTDENGVPCGEAGCLYSRPADRSDGFDALAPKLALSYSIADGVVAYAAASRGFRPPEMTELYRLQRQQNVADLDSEELDAIEVGIKAELERARVSLAAFDMDKRHVILRDANGFNVSNGRTSHRGVEYELVWQPAPVLALTLTLAGTYARHRYEFASAIEGGETIVDGNEVDTAPQQLHAATLRFEPGERLAAELEWLYVDEYWLDAANAHRYEGHELVNLRGRWAFTPQWSATLRLNNVLDRDYADRADFAFGSFRYFPGRGRTLFAELFWRR
jgi:outer membrane receptor protein involved in Fe transport